MSHSSELIAEDIQAYLAEHERKEILRFLTCGSVDDGKSTLIGRLLHDSRMIYADQLAAIKKESAHGGSADGEIDLALLVDGLQAEREQGITIDVAYRYFSTTKRKFIIADCPGHEQYTRNMVTGASTCEAAIILMDASQGVLTQTRRHTYIVSLLGIRHVIVAVNKMDLVDFSEQRFEEIKAEYLAFAERLDIEELHFIPMSALKGDNVVEKSERMPWYQGSTLMYLLENVHVAAERNHADLRFPVQWVNRPDSNFRGYSGTIVSGVVRPGDEITVLPSRRTSTVARVVTFDGDRREAMTPEAVTLTLTDEIDISRGDMIVHTSNLPAVRDRFEAMVVWMHDEGMIPGREYIFKQTSRQITGSITTIRHRVNINSLDHEQAPALNLNEIGRCEVRLNQPLMVDRYGRNRDTGSFIIIDRITNLTVGAGMVCDTGAEASPKDAWDAQPRATHVYAGGPVRPEELQDRLAQRGVTVLFTGLTASGKTTIAQAVERALFDAGNLATTVDGQQLRIGISRDLGFTAAERSENLRRGIEVARILNDAGVIALCAFVAPHEQPRARARDTVGVERFIEIMVDTPLEVCRERDARGLYAAADRGEIPDFPGVSAEFEPPKSPDLILQTTALTLDECVKRVMTLLRERGVID